MINILDSSERYYIRSIKDNKEDVISDFNDKQIIIYKDIKIEGNLRSTGFLSLGYPEKIVSDKKGNILYSSLAREQADNGEVLCFKKDKWQTSKLKCNYVLDMNSFFSKNNNDKLKSDNYNVNGLFIKGYSVQKNDIIYCIFEIPSNLYKNIIDVKISCYSDIEGILNIGTSLCSLKEYNLNNNLEYNYNIEEISPGYNTLQKQTVVYDRMKEIKNESFILFIKRNSSQNSGEDYNKEFNIVSINLEYIIEI